jgi:hypothetical protein
LLMISKTHKILVIGAILFALSTSAVSFGMSNVNAQSEEKKPGYEVSISRDANSQQTISDGASYVSGFDTTYDIQGGTLDLSKGRDLVLSTITDDFDNSTLIGYVKAGKAGTEGTANTTGLANPFVTVEQINEKIKSVLDPVIDSSLAGGGVAFTIGPVTHEIKCTFGGYLEDFGCFKVEGFKLNP